MPGPSTSNHLLLLAALDDIVNDIETAQALINHARRMSATDGLMQLQLDRQQAKLDNRKAIVDQLYINIPMRN